MKKYIQVIDGKVNHIIVEDNNVNELKTHGLEIIDITDVTPQPQTGWLYENGTFTEPPKEPSKPEITFTIDKYTITADGTDTSTINVELKQDGVLSNAADGISYFMPVLKIDESQHDLIEVVFSGGKAAVEFKTTEKSIYSIRFDLIRPVPTATLSENPEIIAK